MPQRKMVPRATLDLITIGDRVIQEVKRRLKFGAGNQGFDCSNWESVGRRTHLAQQAYAGHNNHPLWMAGAALAYEAGNCQEQAAVAYALLRERLSVTQYASFCQTNGNPFPHVFASIGDPKNLARGTVVIVDAWPEHAQAVLLADYFVPVGNIITIQSKVGGKPGRIAKAEAKYANLPVKQSLQALFAFHPQYLCPYNRTHCTNGNVEFEYTDALIQF